MRVHTHTQRKTKQNKLKTSTKNVQSSICWLITLEHEVCPGVAEVPSVTLLKEMDYLSQQVYVTIKLLTFTPVAMFSFINSFIFKI